MRIKIKANAKLSREAIAILDELEKRGAFKAGLDPDKAPEWFHQGQIDAWNSEKQNIVVVAGAQSGKTAMQPHWLLREIYRCREFMIQQGRGDFLYVGPTITLLSAQAIPKFTDLFQDILQLGKMNWATKPKFIFSKEGAKRLIGKSVPIVVHFAYANDPSNLESLTALGGVWDEVGQSENKEASFEAFERRLSIARSNGLGRVFYGTTPYEWNWFKRRIYDQALSNSDRFDFFNFPSWMNPMQSEEQIRGLLESGMQKWRWQMMYEGLYTKPAGMIYDCFDKQNIVERFDIPDEWPRVMGVDFGQVNTAAVLIAMNPETKELYAYGTYHRGGLTGEQHARNILDLHGRPRIAFGGARSEDDWRDQWSRGGIPVMRPVVADVEVGIDKVYGLLATKRLKVFSDLEKLIKEIETYSREINDEGEIVDKRIEDKHSYHRLDALRYIGSWLSDASEITSTSRFKQEEQAKNWEKGRYVRKSSTYEKKHETTYTPGLVLAD